MHSALVAVERPSKIAPGWRLVDALISLRQARLSAVLARSGRLLLVLPAVILVASLAVGVGTLVWSSLHTYDTFLGTEGHVSFTQYHQVLTDRLFREDLLRTLGMGTLTALIAVALALPFSLVMARHRSRLLRLVLMTILFVPYLTGDITRTFGWLAVLGPNGPLAWVAGKMGFHFPSVVGTLWAIGLGTVQVLLPAAVVILLPSVLRLDPELEHAASTLGARPYRTFIHVTLPQLRVACFGALAACWALGMGDFADPQILGEGVKDYLANFLQNRYLEIGDAPEGGATALIILLIVTAGAATILGLGRVRRRRTAL
jgi:putative spermidine/putrescine transport system permease protein